MALHNKLITEEQKRLTNEKTEIENLRQQCEELKESSKITNIKINNDYETITHLEKLNEDQALTIKNLEEQNKNLFHQYQNDVTMLTQQHNNQLMKIQQEDEEIQIEWMNKKNNEITNLLNERDEFYKKQLQEQSERWQLEFNNKQITHTKNCETQTIAILTGIDYDNYINKIDKYIGEIRNHEQISEQSNKTIIQLKNELIESQSEKKDQFLELTTKNDNLS
jgi:hypothetical protein